MESKKVFASSVSSVSARSFGDEREMHMKVGYWGLVWLLVSSHFPSEVTHYGPDSCSCTVCSLPAKWRLRCTLEQLHLGKCFSWERRENLRCRGEYKQNTFPELPHPDIEIGMCAVPPGLREKVLLCSHGTSEWKVWVKYKTKETNTVLNTLHLL